MKMKNWSMVLILGGVVAACAGCTPAQDDSPQVEHINTGDAQVRPLSATAAIVPTITTCSQVMQLANLPFNQGQVSLGKVGGSLVEDCFRAIYPNYGFGYLHSSDHYAALLILLEREPTFREVYDSYHSGSRNIDAARIKAGGGERPSEWASMNEESRLYAVLVHRYGIALGSRILDGKAKDPRPKETEALLREWGETPPPPTPAPVPTPIPTPTTAVHCWLLRIDKGEPTLSPITCELPCATKR